MEHMGEDRVAVDRQGRNVGELRAGAAGPGGTWWSGAGRAVSRAAERCGGAGVGLRGSGQPGEDPLPLPREKPLEVGRLLPWRGGAGRQGSDESSRVSQKPRQFPDQ